MECWGCPVIFWRIHFLFQQRWGRRSDGLNLAISIYSFINGTADDRDRRRNKVFYLPFQRRKRKGKSGIYGSLVMGVLIGIILFAVGIFAARPLSILLGAEGKIIEMTTVYQRTILCFSPCFICNNIFSCLCEKMTAIPGFL